MLDCHATWKHKLRNLPMNIPIVAIVDALQSNAFASEKKPSLNKDHIVFQVAAIKDLTSKSATKALGDGKHFRSRYSLQNNSQNICTTKQLVQRGMNWYREAVYAHNAL